ncbi:hypothetical protein E0L36_00835 [Streptomyces sp. AJS327]|uniref:hypothetical protein n=1 Tax=Streptomyces sp. AJS327 TaxID=2545265 RepID=UPI0015DFF664|nr:hypothetical protein [Streptomyces sp. AJS327]MBA0049508.1 hypothetical protein [Streptomyces sp. AJS327]
MPNDSELATHWFRSKKTGKPNFGDELGPEILQRLGYRVRRAPLGSADIITVGSILGSALRRKPHGLVVWGSGLLRIPHDARHRFRICALRGRITARTLGADVPLGDPGLLVSRLWKRPPVRYRLGVVPHYVDRRTFAWADRVIDVTRPVSEVIEEIGSCAAIATSSLHGLITAQSWGIPAVRLPNDLVVGGDLKWIDHVSALDRPVEQVQEDLLDALTAGLSSADLPRSGTPEPEPEADDPYVLW